MTFMVSVLSNSHIRIFHNMYIIKYPLCILAIASQAHIALCNTMTPNEVQVKSWVGCPGKCQTDEKSENRCVGAMRKLGQSGVSKGY